MRAASIRDGPGDPQVPVRDPRRSGHAYEPCQGVAPLAHERPQRVMALDDGDAALSAVDHDQAERDEAERQQE